MEIAVTKTQNAKANKTVDVLRCISDHLSSRDICKGETYRVAIGVRDNKQSVSRYWPKDWDIKESIFFETTVQVFPNRYRRKSTDKSPVIQHVIVEHFPEIWGGVANGCQVQIKRGQLVEGIYEYRASLNTKNRKWFRVE